SPRESGSNTPSTRRGHHETGRCHVAKWSVGTTTALTPRGCSSSSNHRATVVLPEPEGPSTAMSRTEPRRGGAARTLSTTVGTSSQRTTTGQRAAEGEFVGELQIAQQLTLGLALRGRRPLCGCTHDRHNARRADKTRPRVSSSYVVIGIKRY